MHTLLAPSATRSKLLSRPRLIYSLSQISSLQLEDSEKCTDIPSASTSDSVVLIAAGAVAHTLGLVMNDFLERMFVLNDETAYWNDTVGSPWYVGVYAVQTCPVRLWRWTLEALLNWFNSDLNQIRPRRTCFTHYWVKLRSVIVNWYACPSSLWLLWTGISAPYWLSRAEVQRNQRSLEIWRVVHASSIGLLMDGYFSLKAVTRPDIVDCYAAVSKSKFLMEAVLENARMPRNDASRFESQVLATVERKAQVTEGQLERESCIRGSIVVCNELIRILQDSLPDCAASSTTFIGRHSRPSRLVRYWLPFTVAIFSTSTSLKVFLDKSAQLSRWVVDIASTTFDFWGNWVVRPVRNMIRTIRHDENSDIAIMSKRSLEADRASLERMVIQFVQDTPDPSRNYPTTSDIESITTNVKEGDVTPVLKAYERDLQAPLMGAVRGDLIRALLIQIQKTKVDIEVAMSGIDSLLKSQELVFRYDTHIHACVHANFTV